MIGSHIGLAIGEPLTVSTIHVNGTLAASGGVIAADVDAIISVAAALAAADATVAGFANRRGVAGALESGNAQIAGVVDALVNVTGDLAVDAAAIDAAVSAFISAQAALDAQNATVQGVASAAINVNGDLVAASAVIGGAERHRFHRVTVDLSSYSANVAFLVAN